MDALRPPPTPENTTDFVGYLVERDDVQGVYDGAGYFAQLSPGGQKEVCDQLVAHFGERLDRARLETLLQRLSGGKRRGPDPKHNGHHPQRAAPWLEDIPEEYRPEAVLTDTGNAARFAQIAAGRVRYCEQLGGWHVYDGRRWVRDEQGAAFQYAREAAASIYEEAADAAVGNNKGYAGRLAECAKYAQSDKGMTAMLRQAQSWPGIVARAEQFDAYPWLLNVRNGVIDLCTGELRPHDPTLLITKLVDIEYSPNIKAPRRFLRFLLQIMGSKKVSGQSVRRPSAETKRLVRFLQRAIGYSLAADVSGEIFLVLYGGGDNGKSTLILVLRDLLGEYAANVRPEVLSVQRFQNAGAPTPDVARLRGMRLVTTVETAEGVWLNESLLKQFNSRENISARFPYGRTFEFPPTWLLVLATNHKPNIRGTDRGIWRRIRLIPFEASFPEGDSRRDEHLIDKLRDEPPGILAWAVRGCLLWHRDGLKAPPEVTAATAEYREEMDVLGSFLQDVCEQSAAARVSNQDLYAAYGSWCEVNGEHPVKKREFSKRLEERGTLSEHDRQGKVWCGLALQPGVAKELEEAARRKSWKGNGGGRGRFTSDESDSTPELPQRFVAEKDGQVTERYRTCQNCGGPCYPGEGYRCARCGTVATDAPKSTAEVSRLISESARTQPTVDYCPDCGGPPREGARDYGDGSRCELHDRLLTRGPEGGRP